MKYYFIILHVLMCNLLFSQHNINLNFIESNQRNFPSNQYETLLDSSDLKVFAKKGINEFYKHSSITISYNGVTYESKINFPGRILNAELVIYPPDLNLVEITLQSNEPGETSGFTNRIANIIHLSRNLPVTIAAVPIDYENAESNLNGFYNIKYINGVYYLISYYAGSIADEAVKTKISIINVSQNIDRRIMSISDTIEFLSANRIPATSNFMAYPIIPHIFAFNTNRINMRFSHDINSSVKYILSGKEEFKIIDLHPIPTVLSGKSGYWIKIALIETFENNYKDNGIGWIWSEFISK